MFTTNDIIDVVLEVLAERKAAAAPPRAEAKESAPKGRSFLSEYDVKKALTPGARDFTISKDAIISPLALDWLEFRGIRIIRK